MYVDGTSSVERRLMFILPMILVYTTITWGGLLDLWTAQVVLFLSPRWEEWSQAGGRMIVLGKGTTNKVRTNDCRVSLSGRLCNLFPVRLSQRELHPWRIFLWMKKWDIEIYLQIFGNTWEILWRSFFLLHLYLQQSQYFFFFKRTTSGWKMNKRWRKKGWEGESGKRAFLSPIITQHELHNVSGKIISGRTNRQQERHKKGKWTLPGDHRSTDSSLKVNKEM